MPRSAARSPTRASPLIRGGPAHFPALLQPIVTAPAWLIGDVGVAFRLVQAIGALAMSLAAVPVFLLARRLGLSGRVALALAAFTVLVPDLLYASFVSSEALAYPLVLASVYAATRALAAPTRRAQVAVRRARGPGHPRPASSSPCCRSCSCWRPFSSAPASGARRQALREQPLPLGVFALAAAAVLASGPGTHGRRLPLALRLPRRAARHRPLGRPRRDDARVRGRLDHRPRCAARPLADARPPPLDRGARLRRRRRAARRGALLRGRPAAGESRPRQGDPGALRLLRGSAARALLRPLCVARAGRSASRISRSPPRSSSSPSACRSAATRSCRRSTARPSCSASTG